MKALWVLVVLSIEPTPNYEFVSRSTAWFESADECEVRGRFSVEFEKRENNLRAAYFCFEETPEMQKLTYLKQQDRLRLMSSGTQTICRGPGPAKRARRFLSDGEESLSEDPAAHE